MYRRWIKRLADLTAAVLGLVCTAPLLLAAAGVFWAMTPTRGWGT